MIDNPSLDDTTRAALMAYDRYYTAMLQSAQQGCTIEFENEHTTELLFMEYVEEHQIHELTALVIEWKTRMSALPAGEDKALVERTWRVLADAAYDHAAAALKILPPEVEQQIKAELEQQFLDNYKRTP